MIEPIIVSHENLGERSFGQNDQIVFAELSGDFNPIHIDGIEARKMISGRQVVHGIHGLLWALDCLAKRHCLAPTAVKCKFIKPIFLNENVVCSWDGSSKQLTLKVSDIVCFEFELAFNGNVMPEYGAIESLGEKPQLRDPREDEFSIGEKLPFAIYGNVSLCELMFPYLNNFLGNKIICEIASISTFIGMTFPGKYSMLSNVELVLETRQLVNAPSWSITRYDRRFKKVEFSFNTKHILGDVQAFHLPPRLRRQIETLQENLKIGNSEFQHVTAVVIGGSRGLGNVVSTILCLGGANVTVTYNKGLREASEFQNEMNDLGLNCQVKKLTINSEVHLSKIDPKANQVYYFCSPKIFERKLMTDFDVQLYEEFHNFYVTYFEALCKSIVSIDHPVSIFYPSSEAVGEDILGLEEYAKAKRQGEDLCRELANKSNIKLICPRLPRLDTDQTQSIMPVINADPFQKMLEFVRLMSRI